MSVVVSYKKQLVFGLLFLLIIYFVSEVVVQTYNFYFPHCKFMDSEIYADVNIDLKRKICFDTDKIKFENMPLRNTPNQDLFTININSHGFRGEEVTKIKQDDTYRIFVVGGSTVLGNSATSDETTISGWIQNFFSESNLPVDVEVINAGMGGGFSFTEMNYIKNELINYEPDLFIIYDGWNDITRPYSVQNEDSGDYDLATQLLRKFIVKNDFIQIPGLIFKHYNYYKYNMMDIYKHFNDEDVDKKAELWKNRWIETCELGSVKDFDVIVILQPLVGTGKKTLSAEEEVYYKKYDHKDLVPNYEKYAQQLDKINEICTKSIDMRNVFDEQKKTIFHDGGHVGDEGNYIVAKKLFSVVYPIVQKSI